jgi:hypothetical protein
MKIDSSGNTIDIVGNIKTIEDYIEIKACTEQMVRSGESKVVLNISESFAMTSSLIGHLCKLHGRDKIEVQVNVDNDNLYKLLDSLSLLGIFSVRKI